MPVLLAALHRAQTATGPRENPQSRRSPPMVGGHRRFWRQRDRRAAAYAVAELRDWDAAGGVHRAEVLGTRGPTRSRYRAMNCCPCWYGRAARPWPTASGNPGDRGLLPLVRAGAPGADFDKPRDLPGPTGERNTWSLGGRGVFAAIRLELSVGDFTDRSLPALAAQCCRCEREQTPLVAARAVALLIANGKFQGEIAANTPRPPRLQVLRSRSVRQVAWFVEVQARGAQRVPAQ